VWPENVPMICTPCAPKTTNKHNLAQLQTTESTRGRCFPKPLVGGSTPPGAPTLTKLFGYYRLARARFRVAAPNVVL
jgi:hypothetical protein